MNRLSSSLAFRVFPMIFTICLTGLVVSAIAHETEQNTPEPGFRPQSNYASASLEELDTAANAEQAPPAVDYLAKLEERQGVFYPVNSQTPFTGKSIGHYENGQKKAEGNFKDGKREGLHTMWHENGQKKLEGNFKDGKPEGLHTFWYENGKIDEEECYRNGEEVLLSGCKNNSYEQGWKMLQNSDWEGARAKFTTVIELVPDEWSAWLNRGLAKQNLGDGKGAMEDYNQAVKLGPEEYEVYLHRGELRMRMGEYEGAINDFDNGIQFSPNTREFNQRLSRVYSVRSLAKGDVDDFAGAIKDWKKALELDPQVVKTHTGPGTPIIFRGSLDEVRDFIEIEPKVVLPKNLMGYTLLHLLMKSENPNSAEVCKILIEAGADVNAEEGEGNTPLHFAMYRDTRRNLTLDVYLGTIRLLLKNGAKVNATNWSDGTPLHSAVLTHADLPAIELLLKNGAKVNAKTKALGSYTALHPAASEGRADLVELLLRNGADPNIKDRYENTALDAARNNNQTEVVRILEHHGMGR